MLVTSAGLTSPGVIMIIFDGLESGLLIQEEIDCLSEFIVDDIEDFKQQRLTATHGMLLITALTLFGHILTLFPFRKWQAYWLQGLSMVAVATTILWVIMFLIALRELLCRRVDQPAQT